MSNLQTDLMKDPKIMQSCSDEHLVSTVHLTGLFDYGKIETMVFKLDNGAVNWAVNWMDLECLQTTDIREAAINHLNMCIKYNVRPEQKCNQS